jgi:hypothetical protein
LRVVDVHFLGYHWDLIEGPKNEEDFVLPVLALLASAAFSQGIPRDAMIIGKGVVRSQENHAVIKVRRTDYFRSILIGVDNPKKIEIFNLAITFGDGEGQMHDARMVLDYRTRAPVIDLIGRMRQINVSYL